MNEKVLNFIQRHHLITKYSTILIGVSGGPDSMALLHFFHSIKEDWHLNIVALSVDHMLRGDESKKDLLYVKNICEEWGIPFVMTSIDVSTFMEKEKLSTQVAARELRYQFFHNQMIETKADYLALGHHGDDQVETMFMKLSRSSNPRSFLGIPVKRSFANGWIVRPFLCVTKDLVLDYCKKFQINPRIDRSNEDDTYTRNYFRKHIIPFVKEKNKSVHEVVQRLNESLSEDERYLTKEAEEMVEKIVAINKSGKNISFKIPEFKRYPKALQRRAYHLILNYLFKNLPDHLTYVHEDLFFALLEEKQGNAVIDFPHQLKLEKSYDTIMFYYMNQKLLNKPFLYQVDIPETIDLPNQHQLIFSYTNQAETVTNSSYLCHISEVTLPLYVRTRQPGDKMSWKGLGGHKKIKDIFIDEKIPRQEREVWPIVVDHHGEILWLVGLKKREELFKKHKKPAFIRIDYVKRHP